VLYLDKTSNLSKDYVTRDSSGPATLGVVGTAIGHSFQLWSVGKLLENFLLYVEKCLYKNAKFVAGNPAFRENLRIK